MLFVAVAGLGTIPSRANAETTGTRMVFSRFFGGAATSFVATAVDSEGNLYVAGSTNSNEYPAQNALQPRLNPTFDGVITKFSGRDHSVVYSTYIGGSGVDDCSAIAVDRRGAVYIGGTTLTADFPVVHPIQTENRGRYDTFVAKLSPDGDRLEFSTYLGGRDDDGVLDLAVDPTGNIIILGYTRSPDFPLRNSIDPIAATGGYFVVKIGASGQVIEYSSAIGPSIGVSVNINGLSIDHEGSVYVTGERSIRPPVDSDGDPDPTAYDAFVAKLSTDGILQYVYAFGGTRHDTGFGCDVSADGTVFVTGVTYSPDFPVTPGAFQDKLARTGSSLYGDAFVVRIATTGDQVLAATFLGGRYNERGLSIRADSFRGAAIAVTTDSPDLFTTPDAVRGHLSDGDDISQGDDAYVARLDADCSTLVYGSYVGGSDQDEVQDLALTSSNGIVIVGATVSHDFPVTESLFPSVPGRAHTGFITELAGDVVTIRKAIYVGSKQELRLSVPGRLDADVRVSVNGSDVTDNVVVEVQPDRRRIVARGTRRQFGMTSGSGNTVVLTLAGIRSDAANITLR